LLTPCVIQISLLTSRLPYYHNCQNNNYYKINQGFLILTCFHWNFPHKMNHLTKCTFHIHETCYWQIVPIIKMQVALNGLLMDYINNIIIINFLWTGWMKGVKIMHKLSEWIINHHLKNQNCCLLPVYSLNEVIKNTSFTSFFSSGATLM